MLAGVRRTEYCVRDCTVPSCKQHRSSQGRSALACVWRERVCAPGALPCAPSLRLCATRRPTVYKNCVNTYSPRREVVPAFDPLKEAPEGTFQLHFTNRCKLGLRC